VKVGLVDWAKKGVACISQFRAIIEFNVFIITSPSSFQNLKQVAYDAVEQ
jgi:hypothetical protein